MIDFEQLEWYLNSREFDKKLLKWLEEDNKKIWENQTYLTSKSFEIELKLVKTRTRIRGGILTNQPTTNTITENNTIKALNKVFNALEKAKRLRKKISYTEINGVTVLYFEIPNYIFQKYLKYDSNGNMLKKVIYTG